MARKVFISILGTGFYTKCKYISEDFVSSNTRFAQQAILEYNNAKNWNSEDKVIFFLTDDARKTNWDINERKHNQQGLVKYKGLKYIIEEMNLSIQIVDKFIPDGKNEAEMWEIFTTIFNQLNNDDELYIDLTHSFRYLPMLLLVLSNYAKFLKNIKVVGLSYGNFEARNQDTNEAPIVNLLPITALQDWTFAAADYLENGNAERLVNLSSTQLAPILREAKGTNKDAILINKFIKKLQETTEDFQTCRGINIINSININALKSQLEELESTFIKPLDPVIKKISNSFEVFDKKQNIQNGFNAAKWCFDYGLYQQAATILQENVVSYFCLKNKIRIDSEFEREIINQAFSILGQGIEEDESKWKVNEDHKDKIKDILKDEELNIPNVYKAFSRLTELRNDINHSGMRSSKAPVKSNRIKLSLEKDIVLFQQILQDNYADKISKKLEINKMLINLTNHPYAQWSDEQKQAAEQFGSCVDLPFPAVDPSADADDIDALADEYLQKILDISKHEESEPVVHLMGEMTFLYALANKLRDKNIRCVASTSERNTIDLGGGQKEIQFSFVRFRNYF